MDTVSLPTPSLLKWMHATNSLARIEKAMKDSEITAIEADLVMGYNPDKRLDDDDNDGPCSSPVPIMLHPPPKWLRGTALEQHSSDLTTTMFLNHVSTNLDSNDENHHHDKRNLLKHIKLDFKELGVVGPALTELQGLQNRYHKTIFLNADILSGPGSRSQAPNVDADAFLETCLQQMEEMLGGVVDGNNNKNNGQQLQFAFSLGFKVSGWSLGGYTQQDIDNMAALIRRYNLMNRSQGVVLAVKARILLRDPSSFDEFLEEFPNAQLLAWTSKGEPPITQSTVNSLVQHFNQQGTADRIGFDCAIVSFQLYTIIGMSAMFVILPLVLVWLVRLKRQKSTYSRVFSLESRERENCNQ